MAASIARKLATRLASVHRDERGTISVLSVFTLLVFTFLLVMIVNVASHLDDKIKMQNSADAAAHSGGVVLARGMNAVAYSNHLLCDVFAMTAYLREGRDRQSEQITPEILQAWDTTATKLSAAEFEKFKRLGDALTEKIEMERELVTAFSDMTEAASEFALPVFEAVLREEQIPEFQRALVRTVPELAQRATSEVCIRNGLKRDELSQYPNIPETRTKQRGRQSGMLWRMHVMPVGYPDENDPMARTLPVVDPSPTGKDYGSVPDASEYLDTAVEQRRELSKHYLEEWTRDKLRLFDTEAELSQFSRLWRIFTCGQLDKLLNEEYPSNNLPMVIRRTQSGVDLVTMHREGRRQEVNEHLDLTYQFVAVVYRKHVDENGPGIFRNPLSKEQDAMAFAQVSLFIAPPRWFLLDGSPAPGPSSQGLGGTFGFASDLQLPPQPMQPGQQGPDDIADERWGRENWPTHWDALNQNWYVRVVPATAEPIPRILQADPQIQGQQVRPLKLGGASIQHINQINTH